MLDGSQGQGKEREGVTLCRLRELLLLSSLPPSLQFPSGDAVRL